VLNDPGQKLLREDELDPTPDAALDDVLRQRPAKALLQIVLGIEFGGRRADNLDPPFKRKGLAVGFVNLEP